ncbi:PSP1 domain-containing protein [Myroides injenensis]|uniref:PSP1 domain-containing protein n=1 Tax=Myroides injenensis TaxID=1183151 RepID=UPI000287B7E2|nr:regulatory iron-sulfur-containing complex subunit RicT [Myroides injenensis]
MACTNCSTGKDSNGVPRGCQSHGTCGTDSCNKLAVFDWLSNMVYPSGNEIFDIVEVRFKNGRKDFYRYPKDMSVSMGDIVATETSPGHDIGIVSLTGELVKVQMKKKNVDMDGEILKIYRKATQKDIDIWQEARNREEPVRMRARELAIALNLEMKISDVEFQGDGSKAIFYYTASDRVDFRQLIKDFAREFSIRIEMKQVGFRQEAARLGGIGSCGRELCCSTWLTDFRSVNTAAARYQQLSLNPQKLAGQCGKLKCCLNFELDTYLEALKDMPESDTKLFTVKGIAFCQKIDIFKGQMWFAYANNSANWYVLTTEQVKEIVELNSKDQKGQELESYMLEVEDENVVNLSEEDSVTRFDQPKRKKKAPRKKAKETNTRENGKVANRPQVKDDRVKTTPANENRDKSDDKVKDENARTQNKRPRPKNNRRDTVNEGKEVNTNQEAQKANNPKGEAKKRVAKPKNNVANKEAANKNQNSNSSTNTPRPEGAKEGRVNKNKNNRNKKPKNSNNQNDKPNADQA